MSAEGGQGPIKTAWLDAIARESASEVCIRCTGVRRWNTAALIYETPEWDFFYCYECSHWYKRHSRFRYIVASIEDKRLVDSLTSQVNFNYEMMTEPLRNFYWLKSKISHVWRRLFR